MPYGMMDDYAESLEEIRQLRNRAAKLTSACEQALAWVQNTRIVPDGERDRLRQALKDALGGAEAGVPAPPAACEAAAMAPVPMTAHEVLSLFLRDAATYGGLTDETVCSVGWWKKAPGDEFPSFHARLRLTRGELRRIAGFVRPDERRL